MIPPGRILAELLAARIAKEGPLRFDEFMDAALYHPVHGYYRRQRDPFGRGGDFYTAEQLQPVFGILMAQRIRQLARAMGDPADFTVVELGAGRREMRDAFAEWRYVPVEIGRGELPAAFRGVVFSNEFFDALPVRAVRYERGEFREQRVTFADGGFQWESGERLSACELDYLARYFPPAEEGRWYEIAALAPWLERITLSLVEGYVLTIDYGFTREESARFPAGTLMSYHRHTAREDVLSAPGDRDITAHVNFTAMMELGNERGLAIENFGTLAQMLLAVGEADQFAAALGSGADEPRRRLQLKTLLFGMGETFRTLLQRRVLNRSEMSEK